MPEDVLPSLKEKRSSLQISPPQTPPQHPAKKRHSAPPQFLQERRAVGSKTPPLTEEEQRIILPPIVAAPKSSGYGRKPACERCSVCSKDDLWQVFDVFWTLDKHKQFKLTRRHVFASLRDCVSQKQVEVLRRSRLTERFRQSSQDVPLDEFLRMMWPDVKEEDLAKMTRWCQLRAAQTAIQGRCHGEVPDSVLREIFDLLDLNGDQRVSVEELYWGEILTAEQVSRLMEVAGQQYDEWEAKTIACAALFGKKMDDLDINDLCRLAGPLFDGKLAYREFCLAIKSGLISSE